jgi:5-dehydro-2-deoxygluconokinase
MKDLDVVSLGRVAVDLYANEIGVPLSQAKTFSMYVGGSSGNVAIGTARLGLKSAMLSRVGGEDLGEFVLQTLASEGVETSGVKRDPARLTGLVILGIQPPDRFPLIFYREDCADIALAPGDVDPHLIARTRSLFVTGTALSREPSRGAVWRAVSLARAAGAKVVLDLDFRPMLWPEGAGAYARELQELAHTCDLIVGTEEEFAAAAAVAGDAAVSVIRTRTRAALVLKRGARGAEVFDGDGHHVGRPYPVEILNTLGAGDGFASGLLLGWLSGWDWPRTLSAANAVGALVVTRHGCSVAIPHRPELDAFLDAHR